MSRGIRDYARHFFRNLGSEKVSGRWARRVVRNRFRAKVVLGCCGHRGEPGC
jgi:hypothetical protein